MHMRGQNCFFAYGGPEKYWEGYAGAAGIDCAEPVLGLVPGVLTLAATAVYEAPVLAGVATAAAAAAAGTARTGGSSENNLCKEGK